MQKRFTFVRPIVAATLIASAAAISAGPARAADSAAIEASNWKFSQTTIVAHVGVPMTLHVSSAAGMHGLKSDELGIPDTMLMPGKNTTVTFTPKKAGTYQVHCSVPCGPGHAGMAFTVKVEQ